MRVVAVVSETPGPISSLLAIRLAEQAHHTADDGLTDATTLIRVGDVAAAGPAGPIVVPMLACQSTAELAAALTQLRYAGAQQVFIDCQLPFQDIAEFLTPLADVLLAPIGGGRTPLLATATLIATARRHDTALVVALTGAEPTAMATATWAMALARFAPVVPVAIPAAASGGAFDPQQTAFHADGVNAELLRALARHNAGEATTDSASLDWPATLWRVDGESGPCRVVGCTEDDWRITTTATLTVDEAVVLTLSLLGEIPATVVEIGDGSIGLRLTGQAARKHRLAQKLAVRVAAKIAAASPSPAESTVTDDPAPAAAAEVTPLRRRAHPLLQRVVDHPAPNDRLQGLNRFVAEHGARTHRGPGRIIVVGNEKGGSGKSTLTIHLVVSLLKEGFDVATVDLDRRQGSLTRYLENRRTYAASSKTSLLHPSCHTVVDGHDDELWFSNMLMDLSRNRDFVVLDTPGHDQPLSRLAHLFADTVVTPINDSFLDLDVIARLDPETADYIGPSHYGQVILQAREERGSGTSLPDWIVVRNRLSTVLARNKVDMAAAVDRLSQQMGFRVGPGLTERVIFRELFPFGLTLLDLREQGVGVAMTMSHVAARQELRSLLQALLPGLTPAAPAEQTSAALSPPEVPTAKATHQTPAAKGATSLDDGPASAQIDAIFADAARAAQYVNAG